jgi:hypothetical protein
MNHLLLRSITCLEPIVMWGLACWQLRHPHNSQTASHPHHATGDHIHHAIARLDGAFDEQQRSTNIQHNLTGTDFHHRRIGELPPVIKGNELTIRRPDGISVVCAFC